MDRIEPRATANGGDASAAIDPRAIFEYTPGSDENGSGSSDGNGGGGNGSSSGGPYGHGYFPDGRPRKRAPKGSRSAVAGSRQAGTIKQTIPNLAALTGTLVVVHATLAQIARTPELQIDEREARLLADATNELLAEYGGDIDPRAVKWVNFAMAIGAVYAPRVIAVTMRRRAQAVKSTVAQQ